MYKFKVGDRVRRINSPNGDVLIGWIGTVAGHHIGGDVLVYWDQFTTQRWSHSKCNLELIKQPVPKQSVPKQGGRKDDGDKIRTDLFSVQAYLGTCEVLTFGAKKYQAWNWSKGILYTRVYGAILRHLFAWMMGEENDTETNLSHLDHAACELMFLQHFTKVGKFKDFDDRPKYPADQQ